MSKDPNSFAPAAGHVEQWGMEASPHEMACMMRRMTAQSIYSSFGNDSIAKSLEQQWALHKEAKRAKLAAVACAERALCDLEIQIELVHGLKKSGAPKMLKPPIWREMRVSGAINLGIFQDKVLGPAVGWTCNYHAYHLSDFTVPYW